MLKENPADFLAISYYYTCASSSESNSCADVNDDGAVSNPYIEASEWGWGIDPLGLRTVLNYYYDRYQKPIIIAEMDLGPLMKSVRTDAFMMSVELLTFENISET